MIQSSIFVNQYWLAEYEDLWMLISVMGAAAVEQWIF